MKNKKGTERKKWLANVTTANLLPGRVSKRERKKSRSKMCDDGGRPVSHKGTRPAAGNRKRRRGDGARKGEFDSPNGCGDEGEQIRGAGVVGKVSTKEHDKSREKQKRK